jgi:hypothetical protein
MNYQHFAIHYLKNSITCDIFISGIWPNLNTRKWRLGACWGGFPLLWLGGHIPLAAKAPGGQIWPTAGVVFGLPRPLLGAGCRGGVGVATCRVPRGFPVWLVGQVWLINGKVRVSCVWQCSYGSCGSWVDAA